MLLELNQVDFSYSNKKVLKDIILCLIHHENIAILGPSGSGKTTLFNLFVKWLKPESGEVCVNGTLNYLTQKNLLLKHKTVLENIILPLIFNKTNKEEAINRGKELLKIFNIEQYANYYPDQLSGGLLRRVSLLQVVISNKDILLLDEPFSALDYLTRQQIYDWFLTFKNTFNFAGCLITHDIDEAILLSDRIYILGKSPTTIVDEIIIKFDQKRNSDLIFSSQFLKYKSNILTYFR